MLSPVVQNPVHIPFETKSINLIWQAEDLNSIAQIVTGNNFDYLLAEGRQTSETCGQYLLQRRPILGDYKYARNTFLDRKLVEHLHSSGVVEAMQIACGTNKELKYLQVNKMFPGDFVNTHYHVTEFFEYFASLEIIPANSGGEFGIRDRMDSDKLIKLPGGPYILNICHKNQPHEVTMVTGHIGDQPRISLVLGV